MFGIEARLLGSATLQKTCLTRVESRVRNSLGLALFKLPSVKFLTADTIS